MLRQHWFLNWILLVITTSAAIAAPANKANKGAKNAQKVAITTTAAPPTPINTIQTTPISVTTTTMTTTDPPQANQTTNMPPEVMSRSMSQISSPSKQTSVKKQGKNFNQEEDEDTHHSNEEIRRSNSMLRKSKLKELFRKDNTSAPVYSTSLAQLMTKYQYDHSKVDLEEENHHVVYPDTGQGHPGSSKYSHRIPSHKENPQMKLRPHKLKHRLKRPRTNLRQPNGEHRSSEETVQLARDPDTLDNDDIHAERINLHFESHKPNSVLKHDLVLAGSGNRGLIGADGGHIIKTAEVSANPDPNDTEQTFNGMPSFESTKGRSAGGGAVGGGAGKKKEKGKDKESPSTTSTPSSKDMEPQHDPETFGNYLPWKQIPVPSNNAFYPSPVSLGETITWDAEAHQDLLDRKLFKPLRQERPKKPKKMSAGARISGAYAERTEMVTGGKMDEAEKKRIAEIIAKKYGSVKVIKSAGQMGKGINKPRNRALGSQNFDLATPNSNLTNDDAILLPEVGLTDLNKILAIEEAENGTLFVEIDNDLEANDHEDFESVKSEDKGINNNGDLTSQNKTEGSEEDSLHPHIYRDMKKNHISPLDEARWLLERLKGKTNISRSVVDDEPEEMRHARVKAILSGQKKIKKKKKSRFEGDKDHEGQNGDDGKGLQTAPGGAKKKKKSKSFKNRHNEDATTFVPITSPATTTSSTTTTETTTPQTTTSTTTTKETTPQTTTSTTTTTETTPQTTTTTTTTTETTTPAATTSTTTTTETTAIPVTTTEQPATNEPSTQAQPKSRKAQSPDKKKKPPKTVSK